MMCYCTSVLLLSKNVILPPRIEEKESSLVT